MKKILSIDIETFSDENIKLVGVYKYVESPVFQILMVTFYCVEWGGLQTIDLTKDELPDYFVAAIFDPEYIKTSYNAPFEIPCFQVHFKRIIPVDQWQCTLVRAGMVGLPMDLFNVGRVLKLKQQKDPNGKKYIPMFSIPCKPTIKNGMRTRTLPEHDPAMWNGYLSYNRFDVITELGVLKKVEPYPISEFEQRLWVLDQKINKRGVMIDMVLVEQAVKMDAVYREILTAEAIEITKLQNPNSPAQLKKWLSEEMDEDILNLRKDDLLEILKRSDSSVIDRVIELRQQMSKTSVKKYSKMRAAVCADGRLRGLIQFYGANRTGRWAGRIVQPHNLAKSEFEDDPNVDVLDIARHLVRTGNLEGLLLCFGTVADILKQIIRTAFIAKPGCRFMPADFSAIEARVLSWLAGERWRLDIFEGDGKIYEASAAKMFKIAFDTIVKGHPNYAFRTKGKVAELAFGYQGAVGAAIQMGALKMGLQEDELEPLVYAWRDENPKIVKLWAEINEAAITCVQEPGSEIKHKCGVTFQVKHGVMWIKLPSGRKLAYVRPRLTYNKWNQLAIQYEGMEQTTKRWVTHDTYGGKLVENITQAIARDVLAEKMILLEDAGYEIVLHVHDEVIPEVPYGKGSIEEINHIMGLPIAWAPGLPLHAESYETHYYKKG